MSRNRREPDPHGRQAAAGDRDSPRHCPRGRAQIGQFGIALPVALTGPIKRESGGDARLRRRA